MCQVHNRVVRRDFWRSRTVVIATSDAGDMEERGRALEAFVEERKHEQELEAN